MGIPKKCRHCKARPAARKRRTGLCFACMDNPDIVGKYRSLTHYRRKPTTPFCEECKIRSQQCRGLCYRCRRDPEIRSRYPSRYRARHRPEPKQPCKHCGIREGRRGYRVLCRVCFAQPAIRACYSTTMPRGGPSSPGNTPSFPWSGNPDLFPCDRCVRGAATHPRGLCPPCESVCPDWQPAERQREPLTLCGHEFRVVI